MPLVLNHNSALCASRLSVETSNGVSSEGLAAPCSPTGSGSGAGDRAAGQDSPLGSALERKPSGQHPCCFITEAAKNQGGR